MQRAAALRLSRRSQAALGPSSAGFSPAENGAASARLPAGGPRCIFRTSLCTGASAGNRRPVPRTRGFCSLPRGALYWRRSFTARRAGGAAGVSASPAWAAGPLCTPGRKGAPDGAGSRGVARFRVRRAAGACAGGDALHSPILSPANCRFPCEKSVISTPRGAVTIRARRRKREVALCCTNRSCC